MEFNEIVMSRYATKKFDGKMIPQAKVDELLEMIRYAPSSSNIQPWKIMVVTDPKIKKSLAPSAWNQAQITTCSHLLVFCADTDINSKINRLIELMPLAKEYYSGLNVGFDKMTEEQTLSWAQRQLFLALGNALNGAKSLGFDSCPMEGFFPETFTKILKLPKNLVPTALCPIGYAADQPRPKVRFAKEQVFF
ncbi:MAG: NAD(P)H-dependent oxidoreductase [archaeon]